MDLLRFSSADALADDVAQRFVTFLADEQRAGRAPHIALTGGSTAREIYARIPDVPESATVDWAHVDFWWGDERFVDATSPERNAREARELFLDRVGARSLHEMPTPSSACAVDEGARAYEAEFRRVQRLDLTLLSLGPDGHVASLFPGFPVGSPGSRVIGVTGAPKPPAQRISLTLDALNASERIWIFATETQADGTKHEAFTRVVDGDESLPAAHVRGQQETLWFCAS